MFKKKHIAKIFIVIAVLGGSFLLYKTAAGRGKESCASSIEKTVESSENSNQKMTWETLSHQFFS
jgi:hypothetical protein